MGRLAEADRGGEPMRLVCFAALWLLASTVQATPISVGGFAFQAGEEAFADDAFLVSGTIRITCPRATPKTGQ